MIESMSMIDYYFAWIIFPKILFSQMKQVPGRLSGLLKFKGTCPKGGGIEHFENSGGRDLKGY